MTDTHQLCWKQNHVSVQDFTSLAVVVSNHHIEQKQTHNSLKSGHQSSASSSSSGEAPTSAAVTWPSSWRAISWREPSSASTHRGSSSPSPQRPSPRRSATEATISESSTIPAESGRILVHDPTPHSVFHMQLLAMNFLWTQNDSMNMCVTQHKTARVSMRPRLRTCDRDNQGLSY